MRVLTVDIAASLGTVPRVRDVRVIARDDFALGEVCEFDASMADAATLNHTVGDEASSYVNVILPTATGKEGGVCHAVMLQALSTGQRGWARLSGQVLAKVSGAGGVGGEGRQMLAPATDGTLTADYEAGDRIKGLVDEAMGEDEGLTTVLFDGVYGFTTAIEGIVEISSSGTTAYSFTSTSLPPASVSSSSSSPATTGSSLTGTSLSTASVQSSTSLDSFEVTSVLDTATGSTKTGQQTLASGN